jgi:hypothetical protein
MGTTSADISIDYFNSSGNIIPAAHRQYTGVPAGASRTVVQFTDDTALPPGRYSAVIASSQPVAAVLNQQLVQDGSIGFSAKPPFSSYNGVTAGAVNVTLPQIMYNWFGYYTEVFIMNVGVSTATGVNINYIPGFINGFPSGTNQVDVGNSIPANATLQKSQQSLSSLGAPSTGGNPFVGRFFGSATISSSQPIIAVVNQHNTSAKKLMTYNGFTGGSTVVALPQHMKNWYTYYGSLLIGNPGGVTAHVSIEYTPDPVLMPGSPPTTVPHNIAPLTSLNRYDGPGAQPSQTDLAAYTRFIGSVKVTSDIPVVVQENLEALASAADQAGAYNGFPVSQATHEIVVPLIQADFYGLYTSLTVQNVEGTAGTCTITYTSDNLYSSVPNQSKSYDHPIAANGSFNVYEGHGAAGTTFAGDINNDPFWRTGSGITQRRFIGSATINCTKNVVAFVNSELDQSLADTMYSFNAINK